MTDLVHATGREDWQPLEQVLDAMRKAPEARARKGSEVPEWRSIGKWAWARLRLSITEKGPATGAIFLLLGLVSLALSRWPAVFWAPWLVIAAAAGLVLLRRGRKITGGVLLLAVILLPWALQHYTAKAREEKAATVAQNEPAEIRSGETNQAKASAVATATPDPIFPPSTPKVAPAPQSSASLPVATPPPVPAASVVTMQTAPQAPAVPTPVPESLFSKAGKLADAVVPYLNRAKDALPKLPDFSGKSAPDEKAASGDPSAAPDSLSPDSLQGHDDAIVVIKNGAVSVGNGFACRVGDKAWLFTNAHILAGARQSTFNQVNGGILVPGAADIAPGIDLARFALSKPPAHTFEAVTNFESTVQIGDGVVAFGNSRAGEVVVSWRGVVLGVGPDRVEVSTGFSAANSGGPIVHLKSRKVIGVACASGHPYDDFGKDIKADGSKLGRHFAFRIDRPMAWEPMNPGEFYAEADRIEQISKLTEDIYNFYFSAYNQGEPHYLTDTLRVAGTEWKQKLNRRGLSAADKTNASQTFLNALRFMTRADTNVVEGHLAYTYFREQLVAEKKVREQLFQALQIVLEPSTHGTH